MATSETINSPVSNTRLSILDLLGEGTLWRFAPVSGVSGTNPLCSTYFDNVPIMNGDGSTNYNITGQGFQFNYTSGTPTQALLPGFTKVESFVPLQSNTQLTNPPPGNFGYRKSVVASFNTSNYPDADGIKVTLRVPALYNIDAAGNYGTWNIDTDIYISLNNGDFVNVGAERIGPAKYTSTYLKTYYYPLPKTDPPSSFYEWKVRIRKTNTDIQSVQTANSVYVDNISVISASSFNYPMSALVGLQITADQFSSIPSRAYEIDGIMMQVPIGYTPTTLNVDGTYTAATYPSVWGGAFAADRKWTNNPAWIFYDIVTNKRYGLGNYIQPEWLDKWTLYQIAQICDEMVDDGWGTGTFEPRFTCNVFIQTARDAFSLLNDLVSVFRGILYWANGRLFPVSGEQKTPVYNFTNSNVINGAFNYTNSARNTRSTVVTVKWNDPDNLYRSTPERISDPDAIAVYGYVEKQIDSFATTSRGQAVRMANWVLTVEQRLTETVNFQTSLEGMYLRPGDVFTVYDNYRNNKQQGGRVIGFNSSRTVLTLDRPVNLEAGYSYSLSCVIPNFTLAATGDITGSSQISYIRNSQIETKRVTTSAGSGQAILTAVSAFATGLFTGTTWILSASGTNGRVFDFATPYRCIATSEESPGIFDVLGLEYNTGINYSIENNYNTDPSPIIGSDPNAPSAPSSFTGILVTGLLYSNKLYSYVNLSWHPSTSNNVTYYDLYGNGPGGSPSLIKRLQNTGVNYIPYIDGRFDFSVAAYNAGGLGSASVTTAVVVPAGNILSPHSAIHGIEIVEDFDKSYYDINGNYTGYVGTTPTLAWDVLTDSRGQEVANAHFVSGYKVSINNYTDSVNYLNSPIYISGKENSFYTFPDNDFMRTGLATPPHRGFNFKVETVDIYGNVAAGTNLKINNPPPRPAIYAGVVGYNGGFGYTVTPNPQDADVSGVYFWYDTSNSYTPTFANAKFSTSNLAGFVFTPYFNQSTYAWYSLIDTFGTGDCPIYGPISMGQNDLISGYKKANDEAVSGALNYLTGVNQQVQLAVSGALSSVSGFQVLIDNAVSGAIAGLTGTITDSINVISGQQSLNANAIFGLSGQIMGTTNGDINTALNVRSTTIVVSASGALSTSVDAVRATVVNTGTLLQAQVATVTTALTATGVSLGQRITDTYALVTGASGISNARITTVENTVATTGLAIANQINSLQSEVVAGSGYANALNVTTNNTIATTSGALSNRVDVIQANLTTSGSTLSAQVATVTNALTASGLALSQRIDSLSVTGLSGLSAQILSEQSARISETEALARDIAGLFAVSNDSAATILQESTVRTNSGIAFAQTLNYVAASGTSGLNASISTLTTALAASGVAIASQTTFLIASVSGYSNTQIANVNSAIATTGGAIATQINNLSAMLGGVNATTTILANAFVTGGIAVATWGFELNAAGKVTSMKAVAANNTSQGGSQSSIIFAAGDLRSDNWVSNTAGWKLDSNGNFEGNDGTFRGDILIGAAAADRLQVVSTLSEHYLETYNVGNHQTARIGTVDVGGNKHGYLAINNSSGLTNVIIDGAAGTITANGSIDAASFNSTSSRRYKKKIRKLKHALELINRLEGVRFDWKNKDKKDDFGFIAEDVQKILPEIVHVNDKGEVTSLDYSKITAVLVEAVKTLTQRIDVLELQQSGN